MQSSFTFFHKQSKRQFILSNRTKPHILKQLLKKAFHLQSQIKCLKHQGVGVPLEIHQIFNFPEEKNFEIIIDDESDDRSRSQNYSQKNMSKHSGRKHPPNQRQLLDSKFYVDDFQLFMTEVAQAKSNRYYGIIFFSSKKKAVFLGKKILRQLIFEFDQIEFFYALHPSKMHNKSVLLGQVLVFSLFKGKKRVLEREFPEQITAAQEILSYLKNLIKIGDLKFDKPKRHLDEQAKEKKKSKNLISVSEQRSFDQKNDVLPKAKEYQEKNLTTEFIKMKYSSPVKADTDLLFQRPKQNIISPDEQLVSQTPRTTKFQSPAKSPLTNEISFETEFYQPEWFKSGSTLNQIQKSFLSAFVKENNMNLINFCQGLQLRKNEKQTLNKKLLKVFLDQLIHQNLLKYFNEDNIEFIEQNQQNRRSYVFSSLLKLFKFGNVDQFCSTLKQKIQEQKKVLESKSQHSLMKQQKLFMETQNWNQQIQDSSEQNDLENLVNRRKSSYLELAKEIQKKKKTFHFKLVQPDKDDELSSPQKQPISLIGKNSHLNSKNEQIAEEFHQKQLDEFDQIVQSSTRFLKRYKIVFEDAYSEADIAHIKELINHNDAFMIENFVPNEFSKKKFIKIPPVTVKKYMESIEQRYANLRERTNLSDVCKNKLHKLEIFMSLLYFIYKQRHINRKQLKAFFYLYIWSDLNILSAFELYLEDRDIQQFMDTLYTIDYTYYLQNKYGIDMNEVETFDIEIESQLIMLFLLSDHIEDINERLAVEKFVRAGDNTLYKIYHDFSLDRDQFIQRSLEMCRQRKKDLEEHKKNQNKEEIQRTERNKQRCTFIQQIKPVHFKSFNRINIVQDCINLGQPNIHQIFDAYDKSGELVKWIDSFNQYIQNLDNYHMEILLQSFSKDANLDYEKLKTQKPQLLRGIYESYMMTNDKEDAIDSLEHVLKKLQKKSKSPSPIGSPTSLDSQKK